MVLLFGKSSSSFFYLFLQKQEVLSVGFKQSWVKKKEKKFQNFCALLSCHQNRVLLTARKERER